MRFQYKYIFVAEYSAANADVGGGGGESAFDSSVTTCSSYDYLNSLFEDFSECSMIKVPLNVLEIPFWISFSTGFFFILLHYFFCYKKT